MSSKLRNSPQPKNHLLTRLELPIAASAREATITDDEGREYLDASSGAVVSALGHGNDRVISAIEKQLRTLDYAHRGQFHHHSTLELAEKVSALAGMPDGSAYFFCSGSEAVEAAMKIAELYQRLTGGPIGPPASRTVSYHGSTIEVTRLTGHSGKRGAYDDIFESYATLPVASNSFAADVARATWTQQPTSVVLETISGASGGAVGPGDGYYEGVRRHCEESGSLWVADEVMTGMGRTGKWFAYQHWDALPDIVCVGKGLGAGYWPISAVVVQPHIADVVLQASTTPVGHTYSNHPAGVAAALAVIDEIEERGLLAAADRMGVLLRQQLERLADRLPGGQVHGCGLIQALHFSASRAGWTSRDLVMACRTEGLLVYEAPGAEAQSTDAVLVTPPFHVTDSEVYIIYQRLKKAISKL